MKISKAISTALVFVGMTISCAALAEWDSATVTVTNQSGYTIEKVYMSRHSDGVWHGDRLGRSVLPTGYHVDFDLDPGSYDVKLVDRDGDLCVVPSIDVYDGRTLTITRRMLLNCEGY
jgi:hypothetical protein